LERPLRQRAEPAAEVAVASVAVVERDGGRWQIRSPSAEKDEGSATAEQGIAAACRAFVADGSSENGSVLKRYFWRWTPVLDFLHCLTYVYKAALDKKRGRDW